MLAKIFPRNLKHQMRAIQTREIFRQTKTHHGNLLPINTYDYSNQIAIEHYYLLRTIDLCFGALNCISDMFIIIMCISETRQTIIKYIIVYEAIRMTGRSSNQITPVHQFFFMEKKKEKANI